DYQAGLATLPSIASITSEVSAPYEAQMADLPGLARALIDNLKSTSLYQANLATGQAQATQSAISAAQERASEMAASAGSSAPPAVSPLAAAGTIASLGTSAANQTASLAAAAPLQQAYYQRALQNRLTQALQPRLDAAQQARLGLSGQLPSAIGKY